MSTPLLSTAAVQDTSSNSHNLADYPSSHDPATLIKRGFCPVGQSRGDVKGTRLYYELHGNDGMKERTKRMVFIMGLSNSSFAWHAQLPYFARLPSYSVLVLDNRGVGYSSSPTSSSSLLGASGTRYSTKQMAEDTKEVLQHLGWVEGDEELQKQKEGEGEGKVKRTLNVVGISMGGMIAQELALLLPHSLLTLLLTSTKPSSRSSLLPFLPSPSALLPSRKATSMIVKQTLGLVKSPEDQMKGVVEVLFPGEWLEEREEEDGEGKGKGRTRREVLEEEFLARYHFGKRQTPAGRIGQTAAVLSHHLSSSRLLRLSQALPKGRVHIVHGERDELIDVREGKRLCEGVPDSTLTLVPLGGHALPRQITERYNEWIRERVEAE
ncbi:hypothetical protein JCM8547_005415 [Rhodosporidiobolus lusitaniae]